VKVVGVDVIEAGPSGRPIATDKNGETHELV
jgi:hypothetical protein